MSNNTNTDSNNTGFVFIHYDGAHPTQQVQQSTSLPLQMQAHLNQHRVKLTKPKIPENNSRRSANWDRASTHILIDLYKESIYTLDSSSKQAKSDLYKQMTDDFNNNASVITKRSVKALKRKWEELCNKYRKRMRESASPDELPLQAWEYHDKMREVINKITQLENIDQTVKSDTHGPPSAGETSRKRRRSQPAIQELPVPQRLTTQPEGEPSTTYPFNVGEPQDIASVNYEAPSEQSSRSSPEQIENRQDTLLKLIAESTERQNSMLKLMEENSERQNMLVSTLNSLVNHLVENFGNKAAK